MPLPADRRRADHPRRSVKRAPRDCDTATDSRRTPRSQGIVGETRHQESPPSDCPLERWDLSASPPALLGDTGSGQRVIFDVIPTKVHEGIAALALDQSALTDLVDDLCSGGTFDSRGGVGYASEGSSFHQSAARLGPPSVEWLAAGRL